LSRKESIPIPSSNIMLDDFGWEIPVERIPVPSEGSVYPAGTSLHNREFLEIKAMTAQEEDILTSRALIADGTVISHLLQSCLVDKSVDVQNMLLGDRNALMVAVRITGYGSQYTADSSCPECGHRGSQDFNLTEMEIKRLGLSPVSPGENAFTYQLPVTKKTVTFKFLTGADEQERSTVAERKKKMSPNAKVEASVTARLEQHVLSVDGVSDRSKINMFVRNMPARDSRSLRSYIDENEPGISMEVWMKCSSCSASSLVSLPIGTEFFWPSE
jgi:hypothetical protein